MDIKTSVHGFFLCKRKFFQYYRFTVSITANTPPENSREIRAVCTKIEHERRCSRKSHNVTANHNSDLIQHKGSIVFGSSGRPCRKPGGMRTLEKAVAKQDTEEGSILMSKYNHQINAKAITGRKNTEREESEMDTVKENELEWYDDRVKIVYSQTLEGPVPESPAIDEAENALPEKKYDTPKAVYDYLNQHV